MNASANDALAIAVAEGMCAQTDAAQLVERVRGAVGDGHELRYALEVAAKRSSAYWLAFCRRLQKFLERPPR